MNDNQIDNLNALFLNFNKRNKAYEEYKAFLEIVQTYKSNRAIEESAVIKALNDYIILKKSAPYRIDRNAIIYRARKIDKEDYWNTSKTGISFEEDNGEIVFSGFDGYESKEAPLFVSPIGRSNIKGMPYLYAAEDEYTACAEVEPDNRSIVSLASFEILNPMNLLDLREEKQLEEIQIDKESSQINQNEISKTKLFTEIMFQFAQPNASEEEYKASTIIADYIRRAGFDGIRYLSSKTGGANITIFNSHISNIRFVASKIVVVSGIEYHLFDLNADEEIEPHKYYKEFIRIDNKTVRENIQYKIIEACHNQSKPIENN